jgi:hypothetical protein
MGCLFGGLDFILASGARRVVAAWDSNPAQTRSGADPNTATGWSSDFRLISTRRPPLNREIPKTLSTPAKPAHGGGVPLLCVRLTISIVDASAVGCLTVFGKAGHEYAANRGLT